MNIRAGLRKIILDLKIYYKLNFVYPSIPKYQKIRSIIPATVLKLGNYVVVEPQVEMGKFLKNIGDGVYIGKRTTIGFCQEIGKYSSISDDVKIGLLSHPLDFLSTSPLLYTKRRGWLKNDLFDESKKGFVEIGNDVLISANVNILAGVKIGHGAVIGAGSFVNKDVPPFAIVAGSPGRIIKYRFPEEVIKRLLEISWWDKSLEDLKNHVDFFDRIEEFVKHA